MATDILHLCPFKGFLFALRAFCLFFYSHRIPLLRSPMCVCVTLRLFSVFVSVCLRLCFNSVAWSPIPVCLTACHRTFLCVTLSPAVLCYPVDQPDCLPSCLVLANFPPLCCVVLGGGRRADDGQVHGGDSWPGGPACGREQPCAHQGTSLPGADALRDRVSTRTSSTANNVMC